MSWFLEYNSTHSLPHDYITFLRKFDNEQDFHAYCLFNLPEDYFLLNNKLSFEKVLEDLKDAGKF